MYKLTQAKNTILRLSDGAFIPRDPENRDYKEFLAWEAKGNTPEPADPTPANLQEQIRAAYVSLPLDLQEKYEAEIAMGAFHLERGNYAMLARKIAQAEAKLNPDKEPGVKAIIESVKAIFV